MQSEQNSFIDVRISLGNRRVTIITKCNLPVIQMKKTFLCTVFIRFISLFFSVDFRCLGKMCKF